MTLIKFRIHDALPLGKFGNHILTRSTVLFLQLVKDHLYLMSCVEELSTLLVSTTLVQLLAKLQLMLKNLVCVVTTWLQFTVYLKSI